MTTLSRAVAAGDKELIINAPMAGPFPGYVKVDDEFLKVGGQEYRTGTTLALSDAAETAHDSGATVTYVGVPWEPSFSSQVGGEGGGDSVLSVTSVTLTDAQIKALPTTPVVIVPATEVLAYSGLPTTIFVPVLTIVSANAWEASYGNADAGDTQRFGLFIGSDAGSGPVSVSAYNTDLGEATGGHFYMLSPEAIGLAPGAKIEAVLINLLDGIQDNALAFAATNTSGNFTDGDPANTLKVTVVYYVFTL